MSHLQHLLVFWLDQQRFALPVSRVQRVIPAVEITPLPNAPSIVLGVINVSGRIVPVFDLRKRLRLPNRELELSDELIIATTAKREVALLTDRVAGLVSVTEGEPALAEEILPDLEPIAGVLKLQNGLVYIHDLERFLSVDEDRALSAALSLEDRR